MLDEGKKKADSNGVLQTIKTHVNFWKWAIPVLALVGMALAGIVIDGIFSRKLDALLTTHIAPLQRDIKELTSKVVRLEVQVQFQGDQIREIRKK